MNPGDEPPPPPDAKKKGPGGPGGELTKAYDLLRRVRTDGRTTGRPEERLKDWTDRATKLYRKAVDAAKNGDDRKSREYGAAAHDIARAIDHARNASTTEPDDELPPPPDARDDDERTRRTSAMTTTRPIRPSTSRPRRISTTPPDATPRLAGWNEPASWPGPPKP
jgi:hypothetical protein